MQQDSRGFMWFGSWDGLNRFDGYNFKVFKSQQGDTNTIAGTHIYSIVEDKYGNLWVGTNEALNCYDYRNNSFKHFYLKDTLGKNVLTLYDPFFIDDKDELWFTYGGKNLASFNLNNKKISLHHFADSSLESYTVPGFPKKQLYRPLANILACGDDGLKIIDVVNEKIYHYFSKSAENIYGKPLIIFEVFEDQTHLLWLATNKGLVCFNPKSNTEIIFDKTKYDEAIMPVVAIAEDKNGDIWTGTDYNGLWLFDKAKKEFTYGYVHDPALPDGIAANTISSIFSDRSGNIWINVDPEGIDRINPSFNLFAKVRIGNKSGSHIISGSVLGFAEADSNKVLVSVQRSGMMLYDKATDKTEMIYLPAPYKESYSHAVFRDSKGVFYVLAEKGVFYSANVRGPYTLLQVLQNKFIDDLFNSMLEVDDSLILVGHSHGVAIIKIGQGKIKWQKILPQIQDDILSITRGNDGLFYLCKKENDVIKISYDKNGFKIVDTIKTTFIVKSIYHAAGEIMWMATSKGLAKYNSRTKNYEWFTEQSGLNNNFVYGIVPDTKGNLWISTNGGISRLIINNNKFYNYGLSEGLQGYEFNSNAFYKTNDGTIYFGGVNGFNYFNPSNIIEQPFDPTLQINEIKINNQPVSLASFNNHTNYTLGYNENNLSISFAAIDFNRSASISYQYKLHADDEWINIGKERTLTFPHIPSGNYNLLIKARLSDGALSEKNISLQFDILPVWYKTWWFFILSGVMVLSVFYLLYRYRLSQVIKFYRLRTKISQDLHDEVGSTLTSINILSKVSRSNLDKNNSKASDLLEKISEQSADMQQSISDIVWSIRPDNDKVENLAVRMREFLGHTAESKNVLVDFRVDEKVLNKGLTMKQRQQIFLIYKEAVNNAVKYSKGEKISVFLGKEGDHIKLSVQDDGIGFDTEKPTSSNGLKNMNDRAKELKGIIKIRSEFGKGTQITLLCPAT